jgi:hypothetical protein
LPLVIFERSTTGQILTKEIPIINATYNGNCTFWIQKNAWVDDVGMQRWVEKVWKPFVLTKPADSTLLLMLDQFACHKSEALQRELESFKQFLFCFHLGKLQSHRF